ncbi:MAG: hypothetical protein JWQ09_5498 [Segetibacter sp.]|nr:hypothetical protein [Segetibacter sp.]
MTTGDIVIVSFPYTDVTTFKVRPAVVVKVIESNYNDVIVCLISSVVPLALTSLQILLRPDKVNNLKTTSVIKVGRITTIEYSKVKAVIGELMPLQLNEFKNKFKSLVD